MAKGFEETRVNISEGEIELAKNGDKWRELI